MILEFNFLKAACCICHFSTCRCFIFCSPVAIGVLILLLQKGKPRSINWELLTAEGEASQFIETAEGEASQLVVIMPPKKADLPPGVPSNWSAWKLTNKEQELLEQEVKEYESSATLTLLSNEEKQAKVNDFRADLLKQRKQAKAKLSLENKEQRTKEEAAAQETSQAEAKAKAKAKAKADPSSASDPNGIWQRASLPAGSLVQDDVNQKYYEAVQHDQDTILKHFGASYSTEAALAISAKGTVGEGGFQDRC